MTTTNGGVLLARIFSENLEEVRAAWIGQQYPIAARRGLAGEAELRNQFSQFVALLVAALGTSEHVDFKSGAWQDVRGFLGNVSAQRARQGFTPVETALFVFSLKQPLFTRLRVTNGKEPATLADLT